MKKRPPFEIGSILKYLPIGSTIIVLKKYGDQLVQSYSLSLRGGITKSAPNYNFLYGEIFNSNTSFKGVTKEFIEVK